ncbi:hypothetical protein JCM11251_001247 [Rhodosporidiobolus azoricus]
MRWQIGALASVAFYGGASARAVFAHLMAGEVQAYSWEDHASDMRIAQEVGLDAFAFNSGHDQYDAEKVANVFKAAKETGFKVFFSFDLLHFNQKNASNWILYDYLQPYALREEYYKLDGKPVVSTFGGNQDGQYLNDASSFEEANAAWNDLLDTARSFNPSIDCYFAPFWLKPLWKSTKSTVEDLQLSAVGNWFGNGEIGGADNVTADADKQWHDAAVSRGIDYWAPISAHFSVHQVADRNYVYKGGDFLLPTHYSDLINLGESAPEYIEWITWSDWGESTYMGPLHDNADPPKETLDTARYVDGHDHLPFARLAAYYNEWYKSGSPPGITSEAIFWWHRGHPLDVEPSNDPLPRPGGASVLTDDIYCVVFVPPSSKAKKLVVTTGGQAREGQQVSEGVNLIKTSFSVGKTAVSLQDANGNELIGGEGQEIINNPEIWDFNYYAFAVPADLRVGDYLNVGGGSSSSKAAKTSSAASSVASPTMSDSGSKGPAAPASSSSSSAASSDSSSTAAHSTATENWWVFVLAAFALLLLIAYFVWRSRALTLDDEQSDSSSRSSSSSRRSSVSAESDDSTSSSSSSVLRSLAPTRNIARRQVLFEHQPP